DCYCSLYMGSGISVF
nr:immunoglobulin light chain junction region [Macaca mulatta]MOV99404.1 immunoglobulin light chain junction region [Macaca mulatta]